MVVLAGQRLITWHDHSNARCIAAQSLQDTKLCDSASKGLCCACQPGLGLLVGLLELAEGGHAAWRRAALHKGLQDLKRGLVLSAGIHLQQSRGSMC